MHMHAGQASWSILLPFPSIARVLLERIARATLVRITCMTLVHTGITMHMHLIMCVYHTNTMVVNNSAGHGGRTWSTSKHDATNARHASLPQ